MYILNLYIVDWYVINFTKNRLLQMDIQDFKQLVSKLAGTAPQYLLNLLNHHINGKHTKMG